VSDAPTPAVKLSHGLPVAAHADTHTGHVRANNEDAHGRAWLKDGSLLAVVCDGMGGHQAGEVASGIAVQTLIDEIGKRADEVPQQVLFDALLSANEAIIAEAKAAGRKGMGTTAVTAIVRGHEAYVGLVGDSRLYHVRAGKVLVRTRDHTRVEARLQAEIRLRHADRLRTVGQLAAGLAHELGTPLNVISGRASMIQRTADEETRMHQHATTIREQTDRITALVRRVMDFSRSTPAELQPVILDRLIKDTVALVHPTLKRTTVRSPAAKGCKGVRVKFRRRSSKSSFWRMLSRCKSARSQKTGRYGA